MAFRLPFGFGPSGLRSGRTFSWFPLVLSVAAKAAKSKRFFPGRKD
ncbi:MAG: hypothetical protein OJF61_000247 [Rhodanobacteraceae bacterium]|nr:MAG: hypothetical protein OJF61_000247 [Rhodanobacteraceae bacterium]